VESKKKEWRLETLARLSLYNRRHCSHRPVYGMDLHEAVDVWSHGIHARPTRFQSNSAVHCYNAARVTDMCHPRLYWSSSNYLKDAILSSEDRLKSLSDIISRFVELINLLPLFVSTVNLVDCEVLAIINTVFVYTSRFVFCTPAVRSSSSTSHTQARLMGFQDLCDHLSQRKLLRHSESLHPIQTRMLVQFPEKRLIQYDCGKRSNINELVCPRKSNYCQLLMIVSANVLVH